jgi:(S)-sulfolactate dehydrogenase
MHGHTKKKIVISEFMDPVAVSALRASFDVVYDPALGEQRALLIGELAQAHALIVRNRTQVDRELLAGATSLQAVGRLGVGLDNIDVDLCRSKGVAVIPAVGANALAVAEYVVAVSMLLLRGFLFSSTAVADGQWPRAQLSSGSESAGKTLGIVGFGSVGQTVGNLARAVDMRVIAYDPVLDPAHAAWRTVRRYDDLDALCRDADIVTLHVPLTRDNTHLVDARRLALMKKSAVLINTARGGVVDEQALAQALRSNALAGAAMDVFEQEPLEAGSALANCPNLVLTPHIAGVTQESNVRVSSLIAQRIADILRQGSTSVRSNN